MEDKELQVDENINDTKQKILPMVALRGKVLFPKTFLNFDVGRPQSISAIEKATELNSEIFIATQKNSFVESPKKTDVFRIGVIARIKQIIFFISSYLSFDFADRRKKTHRLYILHHYNIA